MKGKKILIIVFILMFIYFLGGIFYTHINKDVDIKKTKVNSLEIKDFEYTLYNNEPKIYKEEFKKLKTNLESDNIDYDEYAKSISKMFLIDLYNLNSKKNMYDVGGVVFVYPDARENYKLNVTNTLYKYMKDNSDGKRNQELPEIKNVIVKKIVDNEFKIGEKSYNGYKVNLEIEYIKDLEYDKNIELILIKDGKYLYIVEKN